MSWPHLASHHQVIFYQSALGCSSMHRTSVTKVILHYRITSFIFVTQNGPSCICCFCLVTLRILCPQGEVLYRVRWKNYSSDDDTWEPEAHLEDCREVLLNYKKNNLEIKLRKEAELKKATVSFHGNTWRLLGLSAPLFAQHYARMSFNLRGRIC